MSNFKSILQFQKKFNTEEKCRAFLELQRWGDTPACVFCGSTNVCRFATDKRIFKCREKECRKKFSVLVGTVYENTKLPLTKWFLATYILTVHSKGISSLQFANMLDCTQGTAWFLNHRIREMLTERDPEMLDGIVEVDETYIGGKVSNMHTSKRKGKKALANKAMVFGAVERSGSVTPIHVNDNTPLIDLVKENVEEGSVIISDENSAYNNLKDTYLHSRVNHSTEEYVRGNAHTNTIEGYWNLLKKQINGIHHFVSPKHLQRYCNESAYRYNRKKVTQDERFMNALTNCEGRLKYNDLIK